MDVEVSRLLTAAMRHGTYGVNAQLPNVPLSPIDAAAGLNLAVDYPVEAVVNDYEDDLAALDQEPVNDRTLLVLVDTDGGMAPLKPIPQMWDAPGLMAGVAYLRRDVAGALDRRIAAYTLRAVRMALVAWYQRWPRFPPERKENGVELVGFERVRYDRLAGRIGRAALLGVVRATFHVRDVKV